MLVQTRMTEKNISSSKQCITTVFTFIVLIHMKHPEFGLKLICCTIETVVWQKKIKSPETIFNDVDAFHLELAVQRCSKNQSDHITVLQI